MASKRDPGTAAEASELDTSGWQRRFEERFGGHLQPGEALPDLGRVAALVARQQDTAARRAIEADGATGPRQERDAEAQHVRRTLADLRTIVGAALGPTALTLLDIEHETPADPAALLDEGREVRRKLRDASLALPAPRRRGTGVDPAEFADELEVHLEPLERALDAIAQEVRGGRPAGPDRAVDDPELAARWLAATRALLGD